MSVVWSNLLMYNPLENAPQIQTRKAACEGKSIVANSSNPNPGTMNNTALQYNALKTLIYIKAPPARLHPHPQSANLAGVMLRNSKISQLVDLQRIGVLHIDLLLSSQHNYKLNIRRQRLQGIATDALALRPNYRHHRTRGSTGGIVVPQRDFREAYAHNPCLDCRVSPCMNCWVVAVKIERRRRSWRFVWVSDRGVSTLWPGGVRSVTRVQRGSTWEVCAHVDSSLCLFLYAFFCLFDAPLVAFQIEPTVY